MAIIAKIMQIAGINIVPSRIAAGFMGSEEGKFVCNEMPGNNDIMALITYSIYSKVLKFGLK